MKILAIGKTNQIKFETKKAPEGKAFEATEQAIADAKEIGVGKLVTAKWTDDYRVKSLEEYKPKSSGGYSGGSGKYSNAYAEKMVERSVLASVANIVSGIEGVTVKNVQKTVEGLYAGCLKMVRGKAEVKKETTSDDDEFGGTKDTEFGGGTEEEPIE